MGALAQILFGMAADAKAGKITEQQMALLKKQLADQQGISLPQLDQIIATQLPPSHMAALGVDEGLRQKQVENLNFLQDIASHGGMSLDDRTQEEAALNKASNSANRGRQAINADLASRGQLNSGAQLQASLAAEQGNANSARQSGMEAAASAQKRKMDALREIANESSGLRNQDFSERSAAAVAADQRDQWNAASTRDAQMYNAKLPQQQFQNQLQKLQGAMGPVNMMSNALGTEATGIRNQGAGYGAAANKMVSSSDALSGPSTRPTTDQTNALTGPTTRPQDPNTYTYTPPPVSVDQDGSGPGRNKGEFDDDYWRYHYPGGG